MVRLRRLARILLALSVIGVFVVGAMPVIQAASVSLPVVTGPRGTLDELFGQVAAKVPEFGGMYRQGSTWVVYLTNPARQAAAVAAIQAVFGSSFDTRGGVRVLPATYGFGQLAAWHARMGGLFNIRGVLLTDIDEAANRLKVGVDGSSFAASMVQARLIQLGIPRASVDLVRLQPLVPTATLRDQIRPIEGGIQIAFSIYLCTLGFNAVRTGVNGFVVNSHCTDVQGQVTGTQHYQPSVANGNLIGTEIADPAWDPMKCPLGLTGHLCRYSDTAYSQRAAGVTADQGFIAQTTAVNSGSLTISGQFRIVSKGPSVVGDVVNKVGRTTGWSQGQVTATCVDVIVLGSLNADVCQDEVSASVGAGDSGSPVFAITSGNDVQLRGILWGGSLDGTTFVYSPIANIERADELGPLTVCAVGFTC